MYPIKLVTMHGQCLFDEIKKEFLVARSIGGDTKDCFHFGCNVDYITAVAELDSFLSDTKNKLHEDDVKGFENYNALHDECSVLNYFRNTQI